MSFMNPNSRLAGTIISTRDNNRLPLACSGKGAKRLRRFILNIGSEGRNLPRSSHLFPHGRNCLKKAVGEAGRCIIQYVNDYNGKIMLCF